MKSELYKITGVPSSGFDRLRLLECIGVQDFVIAYNLNNLSTYLAFDKDPKSTVDRLEMSFPGLSFGKPDRIEMVSDNYTMLSLYKNIDRDEKLFWDIMDVVPENGVVFLMFSITPHDEVGRCKEELEKMLSSKEIRETESSRSGFGKGASVHRDLYYGSEERMLLNNVIDSLNNSVLGNGLTYRLSVLIPENQNLQDYIRSRFLILFSDKLVVSDINAAFEKARRVGFPFGSSYIKNFLNFYGFYESKYVVSTVLPIKTSGIEIGEFMKEGVANTGINVTLNVSSFNLGFLITGLPGSGKTMLAMSVVKSILDHKDRPWVFIITPTSEWVNFAEAQGVPIIRLFGDDTPINFFRCPEGIEVEKFYGNLAMMLSAAANAGPYQRPMEKCMLNAFRNAYHNCRNPDPINVFNEIEESIIKQHGKRTSTGIKYTKHGENIRASLESLRTVLSLGQYCATDGIMVEDFINSGLIFDISAASAATRPLLYAMALSQIYSLSSKFDDNGDEVLRMLVCVEEAQTMFSDQYSPAVQDMRQRIQDFRKKGIGLMMLAHNAGDIDVGIRRLCQIKMYMKQAPDSAALASKDLIFPNVLQDDLITKLKTLDSRIGAFSGVLKDGTDKRQQCTVFVRTPTYAFSDNMERADWLQENLNNRYIEPVGKIKCRIILEDPSGAELNTESMDKQYSLRLSFLGEELHCIELRALKSFRPELISGKGYTIELLKKSKIMKELRIMATSKIKIRIDDLRS